MLFIFQTLLILLIGVFSLGLTSHDTKENKQNYAAVVLVSVIAKTVTLFLR
jgi:hypothetical protein